MRYQEGDGRQLCSLQESSNRRNSPWRWKQEGVLVWVPRPLLRPFLFPVVLCATLSRTGGDSNHKLQLEIGVVLKVNGLISLTGFLDVCHSEVNYERDPHS